MLLGIDVGGTHTDAVVIDDKGLRAQAKVPTDHDNLLRSIRHAIRAVMDGVDPAEVARLNLSTTLSTNAIVEGKTEEVGLLVSSGPGVDPEFHRIGGQFHVIDGSIDHRGAVIAPLDLDQVDAAVDQCRKAGIRVFAAVSKFSTRNPEHEQQIAGAIMAEGAADFVTLGHSMSGILNFPRRVATAYFNSAVWRTYNDFAWAVEESLEEFGLSPEVNILKADGGTMPMARSKLVPVESILSGPAASVMGIVALNDIRHDCVILDIGGTTTDIAVFADGSPIIEDRGMTLGSYPTLVQSLKVRSIGVGGDSALHVSQVHGVTVGPDRKGPSMAAGGVEPTLTDAMNYLGLTAVGDPGASDRGVQGLARLWDMIPERLCTKAVEYAVAAMAKAVDDLVHEINDRPVYTIFELLKDKKVRPRRAFVMGGPARAFANLLPEALGMKVKLTPHFGVANAVGAALTRTTMDVELFADTQKRRLFIPNLQVSREIPSSYTLADAEADARRALLEHLRGLDVEVTEDQAEITESGSFNMVDGMMPAGRNIRVKCQIRPWVLRRLKA